MTDKMSQEDRDSTARSLLRTVLQPTAPAMAPCAALLMLISMAVSCEMSPTDTSSPHADSAETRHPAVPVVSRVMPSREISSDGGGMTNPDQGWYRGDFHFHTNYSEDALEQGGDWVGAALRIAEYYDNETFTNAFPEYRDNALQFIAITDHRTAEGCYDPEFSSEKLILICGEEFGGTGHAGALNIVSTIPSSASEGRTQNEQIQWAIEETIRQGGLFSANHPAGDDDMWFWDVTGYEGAEVWNTFWTLLGPPTPQSVLDEHVAEYGVENRFIRRALQQEGQGMSGQYLAFYEAHLVAGIPLAAMGGGDRHMLVMPGHPTTYVQAVDASPEAVMEGVRQRHTFVSRSPAGPQLLLSANKSGVSYTTGDIIPAGGTVTIAARVARAEGGRLRIRSGPIIRGVTREELLDMNPLGQVLFDIPITNNDFQWSGSWTPPGEAWFYAQVLESADYSDLPTDVQADLTLLRRSMESYGMRYVLLVRALLPFVDVNAVLRPEGCDPSDWDPYRTICVDHDDLFLGTIHMSEAVDRILNLYREDGELTDYAMGAISSPITIETP